MRRSCWPLPSEMRPQELQVSRTGVTGAEKKTVLDHRVGQGLHTRVLTEVYMQPPWVRAGRNGSEGQGSVTRVSPTSGLSCPSSQELSKKDTSDLPDRPSKATREVPLPFAYDHVTIQVRNSSEDSWVEDGTPPCSVCLCVEQEAQLEQWEASNTAGRILTPGLSQLHPCPGTRGYGWGQGIGLAAAPQEFGTMVLWGQSYAPQRNSIGGY